MTVCSHSFMGGERAHSQRSLVMLQSALKAESKSLHADKEPTGNNPSFYKMSTAKVVFKMTPRAGRESRWNQGENWSQSSQSRKSSPGSGGRLVFVFEPCYTHFIKYIV